MITSPEDIGQLGNFLKSDCGIVLQSEARTLSRLETIAEKYKLQSMKDMIFCIKQPLNKKILDEVIEALVVGETYWFRDKKPFDALQDTILPSYSAETTSRIRIWSAACATGQEPYSIAITINEHIKNTDNKFPAYEIMATDIAKQAVKKASAGSYDNELIKRGLPEYYRDSYFTKMNELWSVEPKIRKKVKFKQFDLQAPSYSMGPFDIIFMRNVLYYFTDDVKKDILHKLTFVLNEGGTLFLGGTESALGFSSKYEEISSNGARFYRLK